MVELTAQMAQMCNENIKLREELTEARKRPDRGRARGLPIPHPCPDHFLIPQTPNY